MSQKKITPDAVKKIESALEERKIKRDRRTDGVPPPVSERRAGRDRRTPEK
jgi:hypothetical protein